MFRKQVIKRPGACEDGGGFGRSHELAVSNLDRTLQYTEDQRYPYPAKRHNTNIHRRVAYKPDQSVLNSSIKPKPGSWTRWSERFLGCRARRGDAECDRTGRSSVFRRKMRPRSGMPSPHARRTRSCIHYAARAPLHGVPRATLRGAIPFQGVATYAVPQKLFNPPRSELTRKVNLTAIRKIHFCYSA